MISQESACVVPAPGMVAHAAHQGSTRSWPLCLSCVGCPDEGERGQLYPSLSF